MKKFFNKLPCYRDIQHLWFLYTRCNYQQGNLFLYYRFWVNAQLRRLTKVLSKPVNTKEYTLHILSGHRDVNQLIWALASWYQATSEAPLVYIHDDGTFTARDVQLIRKFFPESVIVDYQTATNAMPAWLQDFPLSWKLRMESGIPYALKVFDPYFISPGQNVMMLDTDILWFRQPTDLVHAIYNYTCPIFWQDERPAQFFFQNGESLREDLLYYNSGLVYYHKHDVDFAILEEYLQRRGNMYDPWFGFCDQPALAYMFGQYGKVFLLPTDRYLCKGKLTDQTVSFHYLGSRRAMFWVKGVRYVQHLYASMLKDE